ncbi:DMT family transporter [Paucibacter sediminis]|uniref:DMT family transporter n=1 Tax=Paucibacter sediminis TaxID=3019553 RepID=A0AA95NI17_9BURK|nr:DMT family transporter [Paucibacter sp. S2-9]WIT11296.1 DMT family transporter [Paucibacter sp. S2-9]
MSSARTPWLAYASLALSTGLVGSYVGLSKLLVLVFPVFLLAWLRFGFAAVLMLSWLRPAPHEPRLDRRTRGLLFLESFIGNFLFSICLLYGLRSTSAVVAGVLLAGIPAAVAAFSWLFLREHIAPRVLIGVALSVAGIAVVALTRADGGGGAGTTWGPLLVLAAVLCEACYVVIGKRLTQDLPPRRISALINLWGLVLVTPLGLWQACRFDFAAVSMASWGLLAFYATAASMVTVWLWMHGLQQVPAARAGVFMVFLPIATALVGLLALGEAIGSMQALAYGLALTGVLLATWPERIRA